ncbi:hypothetical protein Lser_V15G24116 [Lactuca serriola]
MKCQKYGKYCGVGWTGCPGERLCDDLSSRNSKTFLMALLFPLRAPTSSAFFFVVFLSLSFGYSITKAFFIAFGFIRLVVINPGFAIGPLLQPTLNTTSEWVMGLIIIGNEIFPDGIYRLVDNGITNFNSVGMEYGYFLTDLCIGFVSTEAADA